MRHLLPAIAIVCLAASAARADIFVLHSGGQVVGEPVVGDAKPGVYTVKGANGVVVTVEKSAVKEVIPQNSAEPEYQKVAPKYPDTVQGQWELAEWCREKALNKQRKAHLERVLQLDPDHRPARAALGYTQIEGGRWVPANAILKERGYVQYKGKWVLPQEVEILEGKRKQEQDELEWFAKVKRWRGWMDDRNRAAQAKLNIEEIADTNAVPALVKNLQDEKSRAVRALYIEALARLKTPGALAALVTVSLDDGDFDTRLTCLEHVTKNKTPEVVAQYAAALKSKDNLKVNRAGLALGKLQDPSTIAPLIDGLMTEHKFMVQQGTPGQTTASFDPSGRSGGGGIAMGGGPKIVKQMLQNADVLEALVKISGTNFQYDEKAWKYWYAGQKKSGAFDARRDGK